MTWFAHATAAERYARARPYFHPIAIGIIRARTGQRFQNALDVACGTGQGSRALLEIADVVTGVDAAPEMLEHAIRDVPGARFLESRAEVLPFRDASFDLVTVFNAFHWFDQPAFLHEVRRVLKPGGWLVICYHAFGGTLRGNHEAFRAFADQFYARYTQPSRGATNLEPQNAEPFGFAFDGQERFEHDVTFTAEELAEYISTQSNVIAKVERGEDRLENVLELIRSSVEPMLKDGRGEFGFHGTVWFLRAVQS
jgi:ubiquinone/menaquinone biosynthesis C-methylase UbiE